MTRVKKQLKKWLSLILTALLIVSSPSISLVHAKSIADNKSNIIPAIISNPDKKLTPPSKKGNSEEKLNVLDPNEKVKVIVELKDNSLIKNYTLSNSKLLPGKYIQTSNTQQYKQSIINKQNIVKNRILSKAKSASFQNSFSYTVVLNGFSAEVQRKDIENIKKLDDVKNVYEARTYKLPDDKITPQDKYSSGMIGADLANSTGFTGKGSVVAVLDTGLDTTHEAFSTMPPADTLKYSKTTIGDLVKNSNLQASKITDISGNKTYVDDKVPFAFDYADKDTVVTGGGDHGTHVSGIVAGNNTAKQVSDDKIFKGVAPDAQLMMFKIFSNSSGSTDDPIILAGLEDAITLGADSINMSLGSPAGFTTSGDSVEDGVYNSVIKAGINLNIAAGNDTSSSYQNTTKVNENPAEDPDNAIVGGPSTESSALSVASCENSYYQSYYFTLGDANGVKIPYSNAVNANNNSEIKITGKLDNQTLDYVILNKCGVSGDYDGVDVKGKIAVVNRGNNTFEDKANTAKAAGAAAVIVVNNVPGAIATPGVSTSDIIPMVGVSQDAGKVLSDAQTKKVYISSANHGDTKNPGGWLMSDFSSIGPSPELGIKPEITAPGGNIYSSVNYGKYQVMSGTSMATPHLAGVAALVKQYINNDARFKNLSATQKEELITDLEMSTANPIKDANGVYYPVRKQGAGLVNVFKAINSSAYLTVNGGKPKAELGSNSDGVYQIKFTVNNISDKALTYKPDTTALTCKLLNDKYIDEEARTLSASEAVVDGPSTVNVPANGSTAVTVNIRLSDTLKQELKGQFKNGIYVEGFVQIKSQDAQGIDLSLPFLGFYGNWEDSSVFDNTIYDGTPLNPAFTALFNMTGYGSGRALGVNAAADTLLVKKDKIAFSPLINGESRYLTSRLSLLRNCENLTFSVTSEDGSTVYWNNNYGRATKSFYYGNARTYTYTMPGIQGWDGKDKDGNYVAENTKLMYTITGTSAGSSKVQKLSVPFTIDKTAPTISDAKTYVEDGKTYLEFNASDNQSIQYIMFTDASVHEYALDDYVPQGDSKEADVKVDITGLGGELQSDGLNPGKIAVFTYDYAGNSGTQYIDFGPSTIVLDDAQSIKSGEKVTLHAAIKPDQFTSDTIKWSVDDENIGTIDQSGVFTAKSKGIATITAEVEETGLKSTTKVYVDTDLPGSTGITEPDKNPAAFKDILDTIHGDLSIDADHTEIADGSLNKIFRYDGFDYRVIGNNEAELVSDQTLPSNSNKAGYPDKKGDIVIPDTVKYNNNDYKVTAIGYKVFKSDINITSIVIPDGVKIIGDSAFAFASKLTKIVLPDSVERIDDNAFQWDSNAAINVPKNVKFIGKNAYIGNKKLTDVTLNAGFQELGEAAFEFTSITSIYIPDGVQAIGQNVFCNASNLTSVRLPKDLKRIPNFAFYSSGIKSIDLPNGLEDIGEGAFEISKLTSVTIPSTVIRLEPYAFSDLNMAGANIVIPDSVRIIQEYAFRNLVADSIRIGANALRINANALYNSKVNVTAANTTVAKQIRRSVYGGKITVGGAEFTTYVPQLFVTGNVVYRPTSDTTCEVYSLDNAAMPELIVPEKVTDKGNNMTYTVTSVVDKLCANSKETLLKIQLPDTIEIIGERAFDQVIFLKSFNYPKNLKEIGYQGLGYLGVNTGTMGTNDIYNDGKDLAIPESIVLSNDCAFAGTLEHQISISGRDYINDYEFTGMRNLNTVTLSDDITVINSNAFQNDAKLASINLSKNLKYIGNGAFQGTSLNSVAIPNSVQYVGTQSFNTDYSGSIKEVALGSSVNAYGWNSFSKDAKVTVPLYSQLEDVVKFNSLNELPELKWDGTAAINKGDSSVVPEGSTVTVAYDNTLANPNVGKLSYDAVQVYGKLVVNGTLNIPKGQTLYVDGNIVLNSSGKIAGEGSLVLGKDAKTQQGGIDPTVKIAPTAITVENPDIKLGIGDSADIKVSLNPANASSDLLKYEVTNGNDVVTVSNSGKITALKEGTAEVKVTSVYDADVTAAVKVTVVKVPPTAITVANPQMKLTVGDSADIKVSLSPSNASMDLVGYEVTSGQDLISVSANGKVTALKAGKAVVKVVSKNDPKVYAEVSITVTDKQTQPGKPAGSGSLIKTGSIINTGSMMIIGALLTLAGAALLLFRRKRIN